MATMDEQNPAWSEEDEENLSWFEKFFRAESVFVEGKDIPQDRYLWFKNLKDRVQPQNTWKPSDEQIRVVARLRHCLLEDVRGNDIVILDNLLEQLKALKL